MDNFANLICIKLANLQNLKDTECILGMPQNATGRPQATLSMIFIYV
jgi:hypothetical protein